MQCASAIGDLMHEIEQQSEYDINMPQIKIVQQLLQTMKTIESLLK